MNTNFKRKSQIATTVEQSKRLLAAGLAPESADMSWSKWHNSKWELWAHGPSVGEFEELQVIPAWSLSKLWDILSGTILGGWFSLGSYTSEDVIEKLVVMIEECHANH